MYPADQYASPVSTFGTDVSNRSTSRKNFLLGPGAHRIPNVKVSPEEICFHVKSALDKAQDDSLALEDVFTRDRNARPLLEREVRSVLSPKEQSLLEDRVFVLLSRMHHPRSYSVGTVPNSRVAKLALEVFSAASVVYQAAFPSPARKPASRPPVPEKLREAVGKVSDCLEVASQSFDSIPLLFMAVLRKGQLSGCLSSLLHKRDLAFLSAHSNVYLEVIKVIKVLAENDDLKLLMLDPVKNSLPCLADAVRALGKEARSVLEGVNIGYGTRLQDPKFKKMAHRVRSVYKIVKKAVRPIRKGQGCNTRGSSDEDESGLPNKHSYPRVAGWSDSTTPTTMDSPHSLCSATYGGVPHPRSLASVKEHRALNPRALNKSVPELSSVLSAHKQQQLRSMALTRGSADASLGVPPLRLGLMSDTVSSLYSPSNSFRSMGSSENGQPNPALLSATDSWYSACSNGFSPTAANGDNTFFNPTFSPPRSRPSYSNDPSAPENSPGDVPLPSFSRTYSLPPAVQRSHPATRTAPVYSSFSNPLAGLHDQDPLAAPDSDLSDGEGPVPHAYPSKALQGLATAPALHASWDRASPVLMRGMASKPPPHLGYSGSVSSLRHHTIPNARSASLAHPATQHSLVHDVHKKDVELPHWADPTAVPGSMSLAALTVTRSPSPLPHPSDLLKPLVVSTSGQRAAAWQLQDSDVSVTYSALPTSEPPLLQPVQRHPLLSSNAMHADLPTTRPEMLAQAGGLWQPTALMMPFSTYSPMPMAHRASVPSALSTAPASLPSGVYSPVGRVAGYAAVHEGHELEHDGGLAVGAEQAHVVLVGERCKLSTAMARYQGNNPMLACKLMSLSDQFPRYRQIVGDGNCFYRAFVFGLLEQLFVSADQTLLHSLQHRLVHMWKLVKAFPELCQDTLAQQGHLLLAKILSRAWFGNTGAGEQHTELVYANHLEALLCNRSHSDALVQYVRVVTAAEMLSRQEEYVPFVAGCDGERANMSIAALCTKYVVRMDQEAEELQIIALVRALDVCCGILDVAHSEVMYVKHPSKLQRPLFWLLHCPGHYDLVYPCHPVDVRNGALVPA